MKVDAYLLCSHCLAVGIEKPYLWRGEVLDIKNPKGIYHLQCPFSDADSLIPACFVYPIDPGNTLITGLFKQNFLPIIFSICFRCSKEPSHWDGSFEYPQQMFWLRNKKIVFLSALKA